ncbi:MAG: hypothetical protein M3457_06605 [Chloroflexota bacterium]|nr:hypothetical protein [Chloroflexota bacterium]
MAYPIHQTAFFWNPDRESRAAAWARIKRHIQAELDRIHAANRVQRQLARRQASPTYRRNQHLFHAARQGTPATELARAHGLRASHVREIIRSETAWHHRHQSVGIHDPEVLRAAHESPRLIGHELVATLPAATVLTDP